MSDTIRVPVCWDCGKPHMGRSDVNDRCICDTVGRWDIKEIPADLHNTVKGD